MKIVISSNNSDLNDKILDLLNEINRAEEFDDQEMIYEDVDDDEKHKILNKLANLILISESDPKHFVIEIHSPNKVNIQDFID
jgi:hypothetical protein